MNVSAFMRKLKRNSNGWVILSIVGAILALLPSLYILIGLFQKPNENWQHIQQYMLKDYALQSLWLVLGTAVFTVMIGVTLAWLVAAYDFPFRRFLSWAFVLPLAIPPYIAAYTYGSMLSYTGSVQTFMRNVLGLRAARASRMPIATTTTAMTTRMAVHMALPSISVLR